MNEFQSQGRGLRQSTHPLVKLVDMEIDPEWQKKIDELRVLWAKQVDSVKESFRTPVIADHDALDAMTYSYVRPVGEPIKTPTKNPCLEISLPKVEKMHYVVYGRGVGSDDGAPKCECGKDKHNFAFHMRFCPKWEPIC